ncbi:sensor histidine kinase [Streptomyces sp. NPDC058045]|uniref:sensor histidine kinase n=1 Tax=Streptomyces sp. NPDC058045 TaxID=3346311 RepID=UPI0036E09865
MRGLARVLVGRRARRRWIHLILGGALAMPYFLVGTVLVGVVSGGDENMPNSVQGQLIAFAVGLLLAAVTALFPLTRPMSAAAVRALCAVPADQLAEGPPQSASARLRTVGWFTLHLGVGGVLSGISLAVPPYALLLLAAPFSTPQGRFAGMLPAGDGLWGLAVAPPIGLLILLALAGCATAASGLLARCAPALLGPTPADRLAEAERRAADLAVRGRLARELHDSVGHALSAVTLQAGAARRVLDSDPAFVREALAAIEETTRRTVGELDAVLGVLRDGDTSGPTAPAPTLDSDLAGLLRRTRAAGVRVDAELVPGAGGWAGLPGMVSREAYRIVQEALGNALRHAGAGARVRLRVAVEAAGLEITAANPLPAEPGSRPGGGHGIAGVADRVRLLGGTTTAGPDGGDWCLRARLPLAPGTGSAVTDAVTDVGKSEGKSAG